MDDHFVRNGERDRRMVEQRVARVGYFGTDRRVGDRRAHERRRPDDGGGRDPLSRAFWLVALVVILLIIDRQVFGGFYIAWAKSSLSAFGARTQDWSGHLWLG